MEEEKICLSSERSIEGRVEYLLGKMTLQEKIGQLKASVLDLHRALSEFTEELSEHQKREFERSREHNFQRGE